MRYRAIVVGSIIGISQCSDTTQFSSVQPIGTESLLLRDQVAEGDHIDAEDDTERADTDDDDEEEEESGDELEDVVEEKKSVIRDIRTAGLSAGEGALIAASMAMISIGVLNFIGGRSYQFPPRIDHAEIAELGVAATAGFSMVLTLACVRKAFLVNNRSEMRAAVYLAMGFASTFVAVAMLAALTVQHTLPFGIDLFLYRTAWMYASGVLKAGEGVMSGYHQIVSRVLKTLPTAHVESVMRTIANISRREWDYVTGCAVLSGSAVGAATCFISRQRMKILLTRAIPYIVGVVGVAFTLLAINDVVHRLPVLKMPSDREMMAAVAEIVRISPKPTANRLMLSE